MRVTEKPGANNIEIVLGLKLPGLKTTIDKIVKKVREEIVPKYYKNEDDLRRNQNKGKELENDIEKYKDELKRLNDITNIEIENQEILNLIIKGYGNNQEQVNYFYNLLLDDYYTLYINNNLNKSKEEVVNNNEINNNENNNEIPNNDVNNNNNENNNIINNENNNNIINNNNLNDINHDVNNNNIPNNQNNNIINNNQQINNNNIIINNEDKEDNENQDDNIINDKKEKKIFNKSEIDRIKRVLKLLVSLKKKYSPKEESFINKIGGTINWIETYTVEITSIFKMYTELSTIIGNVFEQMTKTIDKNNIIIEVSERNPDYKSLVNNSFLIVMESLLRVVTSNEKVYLHLKDDSDRFFELLNINKQLHQDGLQLNTSLSLFSKEVFTLQEILIIVNALDVKDIQEEKKIEKLTKLIKFFSKQTILILKEKKVI